MVKKRKDKLKRMVHVLIYTNKGHIYMIMKIHARKGSANLARDTQFYK